MIRRVLYDFELLLNQLGGWGLPNVQTLWASANSFWHKSRRFPVNRIGYIEEVKSILLQIYNTLKIYMPEKEKLLDRWLIWIPQWEAFEIWVVATNPELLAQTAMTPELVSAIPSTLTNEQLEAKAEWHKGRGEIGNYYLCLYELVRREGKTELANEYMYYASALGRYQAETHLPLRVTVEEAQEIIKQMEEITKPEIERQREVLVAQIAALDREIETLRSQIDTINNQILDLLPQLEGIIGSEAVSAIRSELALI